MNQIISEERVLFLDREFASKNELLSTLLDVLLKLDGLTEHREVVLETLLEREASMSTGIGQGIAIPHCSSEFEKDVSALLCVLGKPMEYQAVDDQPIQIVILLLLPKDRFEKHIKTLAAIARQFNDVDFRNRVATAKSQEEVCSIVGVAGSGNAPAT
ncbi:MAG: PTS sugar transporter subunit IIA [Spirochaetia bacterium]|nr:PTS sugar transporter subunit IIA [Spirochaetia bacterium]